MPPTLLVLHLDTADGDERTIDGWAGQTLMRAAVDAGVDEIVAECGGVLSCATCHVVVDEAWAAALPPPSDDEQVMLDLTAAPREARSRLSCQIVLTEKLDGLRVRLPERQY